MQPDALDTNLPSSRFLGMRIGTIIIIITLFYVVLFVLFSNL